MSEELEKLLKVEIGRLIEHSNEGERFYKSMRKTRKILKENQSLESDFRGVIELTNTYAKINALSHFYNQNFYDEDVTKIESIAKDKLDKYTQGLINIMIIMEKFKS